MRKKTHEEYILELSKSNPNIEVIGLYTQYKTKIKHRCKIDDYEWMATPANILRSKRCPLCRNKKLRDERMKSHNEYVEDVNKLHKNIEVIGTYVGSHKHIAHRCNIDGYEWDVAPTCILNGQGCPVCAGKRIGPHPEYRNSIWASKYKEYCSQYMSEEQMKTISPMSHKKINCTCPNCNHIKPIIVSNLIKQGFGCFCEDGQSFPNKFVYNVLKQLGVRIKPECVFPWSNNKRYDDYLVDYNIIIENHGQQHYEECLLSKNTSLQAIQQNDLYKKNLAIKNGIAEYIVIDCRKSNVEYIRSSILNSKLPLILNFTNNDIDWAKAYNYARTNICKIAVDLYNNGNKIKNISQELGISVNTIQKWINDASRLGACKHSSCKKRTYCIELNMTFESVTQAAKFLNQKHISHIAECCRGQRETAYGYHWRYIIE